MVAQKTRPLSEKQIRARKSYDKYDYNPKVVSQEDVNFYKMLRLTNSYVGMDKVDVELKRAPQTSLMDKKRATINTSSKLNHLFQNELDMITAGSKTTKKYNQLKQLAYHMNKKEKILNSIINTKKGSSLGKNAAYV